MIQRDKGIKTAADHSIEQLAENSQTVNGKHSPSLTSWVNNEWLLASFSFILLIVGLIFDHIARPNWFEDSIRVIWYIAAYIPAGFPVLVKGIKLAFRREFFTEFILMSIATIGAFYVGEYPEGVAVMVFYAIGELFQGAAVSRAKRSIKALLDVRPAIACVQRDGRYIDVDPTKVNIGETIQVKVGERVPLDGTLCSDESTFNTSALTGESKPISIGKSDQVLAGMINQGRVVQITVSRLFNDSSLARILTLVQNAQGRKARTELFIRRFAKVYTPIVVIMAVALTLMPYFFIDQYVFDQWLYRALIFLVISCPCALVVAIPLGYFGGIGAGSRNGILFKGSSYLDRMTRIDTVVMDKTGTLTKGVFKVQEVKSLAVDQKIWLPMLAALENNSTHPIAKALVEFSGPSNLVLQDIEEIKGYGLKANTNGERIFAGNAKLLEKFGIEVPLEFKTIQDTVILVALGNAIAGYVRIADEIKDDAQFTINQLHSLGIKTVMLSGDNSQAVERVALELKIESFFSDLLPEEKVNKLEEIKRGNKEAVAFVGDGINDAPALAISDVGIAMGGLGSDAAIETADVVIQTDQPSKIVTAIKIGKATNAIVWQNIALAFGVKIMVMALGAWGVASMWEAVFADVGVALLAILNAVRIQARKF